MSKYKAKFQYLEQHGTRGQLQPTPPTQTQRQQPGEPGERRLFYGNPFSSAPHNPLSPPKCASSPFMHPPRPKINKAYRSQKRHMLRFVPCTHDAYLFHPGHRVQWDPCVSKSARKAGCVGRLLSQRNNDNQLQSEIGGRCRRQFRSARAVAKKQKRNRSQNSTWRWMSPESKWVPMRRRA